MNRHLLRWAAVAAFLIALSVWLAPTAWRVYAIRQIESAKRQGVYSTPEEGLRHLIEESYRGIERIEIHRPGIASFDGRLPHVWFVTARVYAAMRGDGKAIDEGKYDLPGSYFLQVDDGWVHVPEGAFPMWIGRAMARFELYGCEHEKHNCD
jgi:hypothetical protein